MATTYLTVVNELLTEMNEVKLTSSNFSSATNVQAHAKNVVNRAYMDIVLHRRKWPFLVSGTSQDDVYGNQSIETTAGTRWYYFNPSRSTDDDDYGWIDWDRMSLTTSGVAGETTPYTYEELDLISIEEWRDYWKEREDQDKNDTQNYGVPRRVIRHPNNIQFGLSSIPDKAYKIYFFAWDQPAELSGHNDELAFIDKFRPVLNCRARYYMWQFKENYQQASLAEKDYKQGLTAMRQELIGESTKRMKDDRIRFT